MIIKVFIFAFLVYISIHIGAYAREKGYSKEFSYFIIVLSFFISPLGTFILVWLLPEKEEESW